MSHQSETPPGATAGSRAVSCFDRIDTLVLIPRINHFQDVRGPQRHGITEKYHSPGFALHDERCALRPEDGR